MLWARAQGFSLFDCRNKAVDMYPNRFEYISDAPSVLCLEAVPNRNPPARYSPYDYSSFGVPWNWLVDHVLYFTKRRKVVETHWQRAFSLLGVQQGAHATTSFLEGFLEKVLRRQKHILSRSTTRLCAPYTWNCSVAGIGVWMFVQEDSQVLKVACQQSILVGALPPS